MSRFGAPHTGPWIIVAIRVLFWIYAAWTLIYSTTIPVILFNRRLDVFKMNPAIFFIVFNVMLTGTIAASIAQQQPPEQRLRIIVAQERSTRGGPDYLPLLQRELLEVIRKYVNVDVDAVKVDLVKDGEHDVLDISVSLPDKNG